MVNNILYFNRLKLCTKCNGMEKSFYQILLFKIKYNQKWLTLSFMEFSQKPDGNENQKGYVQIQT